MFSLTLRDGAKTRLRGFGIKFIRPFLAKNVSRSVGNILASVKKTRKDKKRQEKTRQEKGKETRNKEEEEENGVELHFQVL